MIAETAPWEGFAGVAVTALLALLGTVWQGRKTRRDNDATRELNTSEHMVNARKLDRIADAVEDVANVTRRHSRRLDRIDERIDRINEQKGNV